VGLTGEEKKAYQREYMARRRGSNKSEGGSNRINPHTGKAYGPMMAGMPSETLDEYERKWGQMGPCYVEHERRVVKPVLVIGELSQTKKDELYRGLQAGYSRREM